MEHELQYAMYTMVLNWDFPYKFKYGSDVWIRMDNTNICSWVDEKLKNLLGFNNPKVVLSIVGLVEKATTFKELISHLEGFGFPTSDKTTIFAHELIKRASLR